MAELLDLKPPLLAEEVLSVLQCITCHDRLEDRGSELACAGCGQKYPRVQGVVRCVDAQQYAGSFGFQWHVHATTQLDSAESSRSERAFRRRTGFRPGKLRLHLQHRSPAPHA